MQDAKGTLYIISAPSGCGKTSMVDALIASTPDIVVSVSHTTRPMRPAEQDGVNYFFIAETEFQSMVNQHLFLEYANVFGNWYGTSKAWVENELVNGRDVILEIDWQGARQVKWMLPESIGIFILPPSLEALQSRLQSRGQDAPAVIAKRMAQAAVEISHYQEYEYIIINDDFQRSVRDLQAVVITERLKLRNQLIRQHTLLQGLSPINA
jgi:guanylate kinase